MIAVAIAADWIGLGTASVGLKQVLFGLAGLVVLILGFARGTGFATNNENLLNVDQQWCYQLP